MTLIFGLIIRFLNWFDRHAEDEALKQQDRDAWDYNKLGFRFNI